MMGRAGGERSAGGAITLARRCVELPLAWCWVRIDEHVGDPLLLNAGWCVSIQAAEDSASTHGRLRGGRVTTATVAECAVKVSHNLGSCQQRIVSTAEWTRPRAGRDPWRPRPAGRRSPGGCSRVLRSGTSASTGIEPNCRVLAEAAAKAHEHLLRAGLAAAVGAVGHRRGEGPPRSWSRCPPQRGGVHEVRDGPCRAAPTGASGALRPSATNEAHHRPAGYRGDASADLRFDALGLSSCTPHPAGRDSAG
jgi:hypothetical protein